jgi:hypothetical protein
MLAVIFKRHGEAMGDWDDRHKPTKDSVLAWRARHACCAAATETLAAVFVQA